MTRALQEALPECVHPDAASWVLIASLPLPMSTTVLRPRGRAGRKASSAAFWVCSMWVGGRDRRMTHHGGRPR